MLVSWVLFPLLLALVSLGCGLLLERIAGVRLPGPIVPAAGFAVVVVAVHFTTLGDTTAELSVPVVVALAILGVVLSPPWRRGTVDGWATATAVGVFAVFAAPIVLSGEATFAGYIKLDDTATWLAITDRVMEHGRDLGGLPPSSYEATLAFNLPGGYPIGAFFGLGVGHALTGQDSAWLFQPYMAFLAAMLATALYALVTPILRSRPLRAVAVFVSSQAALLFAYTLWGGVKEIAAACMLGLIAATAAPAIDSARSGRAVLPLAVASAATLAVLSFGGAIWLAPLLLVALALTVRAHGAALAGRRAVGFLAAGAVLALPALLKAKQFLDPNSGTLTNTTDLGNLVKPLDWMQFFGIWPTGDFRVAPYSIDATHLLIGVVVAAGLLGLVLAWRRGANGFLIYTCGTTVGCCVVVAFGSPWIDAKALATASPVFVLAGVAAGGAVFESGRRIEGILIAATIAGGVLWSNALAYKDVTLAPHDRLAQLEDIGQRFAGQGPSLMTDYEPYGVRHFLRRVDPEGASELRRRFVLLRNGSTLQKLQVADIDQFMLPSLMAYRTLVLRRSPLESRPPLPFKLVRQYSYYDVWQRPEGPSGVAEHLPLGDNMHPTAAVRCADALRLAREAGPLGRLAVAARNPDPIVIDLPSATRPTAWQPTAGVTGAVTPGTPGSVETLVHVSAAGRYGIWVGGAFRRELDVLVDGKVVSAQRHQLSHSSQYLPLAETPLTARVHRVALRYGDADLHPGSGDPPFYLGPVVLATPGGSTVRFVSPRDARSLCDKRFDWIEALRRAP